MNEQNMIVYLDASHDPVTIGSLMKRPPAIYIGKTEANKRAVVKISDHDPIVNMQVVLADNLVSVTEYYSDGRINEYEKRMPF